MMRRLTYARMKCSGLFQVLPVLALLAVWILTFVQDATAQSHPQLGERISDYQVGITINKDRSVDVVERITVNVLGDVIKRGLLRDIPVSYRSENGLTVNIDLEVKSVLRDGRSEPFSTSSEGRYLRIRTGEASVFLTHQFHTFEISYSVRESIGFFEDYDEFYWIAIGTEWAFPIDKATVSVKLPEKAVISDGLSVYTGPPGAAGRDYEIVEKSSSYVEVQSTRPFTQGEGLTIAVPWQKGVISPPNSTERAVDAVVDNIPLFLLALGALLQFGWLYWAWDKVGRDPQGGAIIPRFHAPKGISPAVASYVAGLGSFEKSSQASFMGALTNLAIKKFITIDDQSKDVTIVREMLPNTADVSNLPVGERALFRELLSDRAEATFADMKFKEMSKVMGAFARAVDKETNKVYFRRNTVYIWPAFVAALLAVILFALTSLYIARPQHFPILEIVAAGILSSIISLFRTIWCSIRGRDYQQALKGFVLPIFFCIFIAVFYAASGAEPVFRLDYINLPSIAVLVFMIFTQFLFSEWMKAPTKLGRKVMDEIEGLKMFMTVTVAAQAEEAEAAGMPELTPKLYEDLLPYAIALGIEKTWSDSFEDKVFSQIQEQGAYRPTWYRGDSFNPSRPTAVLSSVTGSLGADLSSAMTPPASSSSGSSGGGSSGGGGGGGGGGGW